MSKPIRQFGRIVRVDARDKKYSLVAKTTSRISRTWDTKWLSCDQEQTPECVAFAWSHWLAGVPIKQFLDPHGLYAGCKLIDGEPDAEGTYVRAAAKILQKAGFIREYRWANTLKAMVCTVLELGPVVFGSDWWTGMNDGGVMTLDGEVLGGHAYLIVGANRKTEQFRIKNSWGKAWGDGGYATLPFAAAAKLLKDGAEACLATEAKPEAAWLK